MKRITFIVIVCIACVPFISAQRIGIKTNLLYDLTSTINLGVEAGWGEKWSLDLPVNYNPWSFPGDRQIKHWLIQPEVRYWLCEKFNGHFFGLHTHVAGFNVSGIKWMGFKDSRNEGYAYGAGISYGYQWTLAERWSIEAVIGLGYAYFDYGKYPCGSCRPKIDDVEKHYFGPTKAGVSLIYIIK
ncbi:MAG: DUF3575 domain-containing protein [Tannerellaceae bacterium]|nr:DUF3575 domain-containing protein [Tannerellaceae bacterium]